MLFFLSIVSFNSRTIQCIKMVIFFKSNSYTEVLLELYRIKKEKMLDEIEGIFSLVIYDKIEKVIFTLFAIFT